LRRIEVEVQVLLTDIGMPVMDGYVLFRELKSISPELLDYNL
jgi:YesN/AraC family two-component response regulator